MIPETFLQEMKKAHPGYVTHWVYLEHGLPTMIIARYDTQTNKGKKEKFFDQWHYYQGKWERGILTGPLPLFGLHTLNHSSPFNALFIVEGEKCATALHHIGWPAVTNCLGGGAVDKSDFTPLRICRRFIIMRDNDQTGIDFARKVARQLLHAVEDAEIHICNLTPDLPKGDVIDWIQQYPLSGHNWDGLSALSDAQITCTQKGLYAAIETGKKLIQECPSIRFKPEHLLFSGEPQELEDRLLPVPQFPLDCLASPIKDYCQIRASQTCLPPDFGATAFLGILSGLIGRAYQLEMRPNHDWFESANLWGLLVGNPATLKSPTIKSVSNLCLTPLDKLAKEQYERAHKEYKQRQKAAKEGDIDFDEVEPLRRRFHTDDPTVASLKKLFSSNPRGIILRTDETSGQLRKFEQDNYASDRAFYLSCWSGQETYHEDRISRDSLLDLRLALSWVGGIQPNTLKPYLEQAVGVRAGGDGLMQRFQLISYPDLTQKFQDVDILIPDGLRTELMQIAARIDALCISESVLHFSPDAQQALVEWNVSHQNKTRSEEAEYWQSHLGKIPKLVGALCLQLYIVDCLSGNVAIDNIPLHVLERAFRLTEYFIAHAKRAYGSIESQTLSDARKILHKIKSGKLKARFKASEIYHNCSCSLRDPAKTYAALDLLYDKNIVAPDKQQFGIGRPGTDWIVHPNLVK